MPSQDLFMDAGRQKMKTRKSRNPTAAGPKQPGAGADMEADMEDEVMRWVERKPRRSLATGPPTAAASSTSTTMSERPPKQRRQKTRGRLDRAVLAMLGKGLEGCFDDIRKQEVPERFRLLLRQF
jgi:hypothetical protein